MNYLLFIFILILVYILNQFYKRIDKLEKLNKEQEAEKSSGSYSWSFNIDTQLAIITNPLFGKLSGIKSAEDGKNASQWTAKEQKIWQEKWKDQIFKKSHIFITYLAKEDAFFSHDSTGSYGFNFCSIGGEDVFGETVIEEKETEKNKFSVWKDSLDLRLKHRHIDLGDKREIRVLTVYLIERFSNGDKNYKVLCDFPFTMASMDFPKKLGFEVELSEGDVFEDKKNPLNLEHGGWSKVPDITTWKKNGVVITHVSD
jgi:hypothetical protein